MDERPSDAELDALCGCLKEGGPRGDTCSECPTEKKFGIERCDCGYGYSWGHKQVWCTRVCEI